MVVQDEWHGRMDMQGQLKWMEVLAGKSEAG